MVLSKNIYTQGFMGLNFKDGYLHSHAKCLCGGMATVNPAENLTFCPSCKTLRNCRWDGKGWSQSITQLSYIRG